MYKNEYARMDRTQKDNALRTWRLQNPHATQLPEWARPEEREEQRPPVIYVTPPRITPKWTTVQAFTVNESGSLEFAALVRYQHGATRGHDYEIRSALGLHAVQGRWEVREINA